jgi:hypothetical protein
MASMPDLVVESIDALSERQRDLARVIYEDAFSAELRVPFDELTLLGSTDQTFVALDGKTPVGFAALRLLSSVQWSFLRFFAIDADRRSQALGSRFWQLLQPVLQTKAWPANTVFEVEHPEEESVREAERVIRERRIRFWTACGARLLPATSYMQPDYTASGVTEPMLLMSATPAAVEPPRGNELRALVRAIYTDRYGMSADDPLVSVALASITS